MIGAVLDTNVLVNVAIKADGIAAQILALAEERFILLTSEFILEETSGVLARKHIQARYRQRTTASQRHGFLQNLREAAVLVNVKTKLSVIGKDSKDNPVLACAIDGDASCVVTGDWHLLELGTDRGIQMLTPAQFLRIIQEVGA